MSGNENILIGVNIQNFNFASVCVSCNCFLEYTQFPLKTPQQ